MSLEGSAPLWTPYPEGPQAAALDCPATITGYGGAAGGGKALALDTPLPTPRGWTTMGDVRPGDTLLDEQGRPATVLAVSEVFHDHDCYEVEFSDGSVIVADADHRWLTFTDRERLALSRSGDDWRARRRSRRPPRGTGKRPDLALLNAARRTLKPPPTGAVRTTREIAGTLALRGGRTNHSVPTAAPLQLPDSRLLVPPYTLGAWLGDGKTTAGKIYVGGADPGILDRVRLDGFTIRPVASERLGWTILGLQPVLRALGVLGNKHVPVHYLRSSHSQRLELLRGLMDTDGCCDMDGGGEFTSTNERLALGVLELARTLGIKSSLTEGRATLYGKDCGPKYRVKLTTDLRVFHLARKAERQNVSVRGTRRSHYLVACRPVATTPVKCAAVDSPSKLFLAGRAFIPTHNTDLILGAGSTRHRSTLVFRREYPQLKGMIERGNELFVGPGHARWVGAPTNMWRFKDGRRIELGAVQHEKDKLKYRGRPHDLKAYDEATEIPESVFWFTMGWMRSTVPDQRCRAILTFNPPTNVEGMWVVRLFGPWLDRKHHDPALPGEIRYFARLDDKLVWRDGPEPFDHRGETVTPISLTFFPARLADNPVLAATAYGSTIQALPEPLRSQLLYGDFDAGVEDDPWQVIPTAWAEAAMARWRGAKPIVRMTCVGMDVAHGGKAKTVLAPRYGNYVAALLKYPGKDTPNGATAAALAVRALERGAYVNVDAIGYGASAAERLSEDHKAAAYPVNAAAPSEHTDRSGKYRMVNVRAEMFWRLRESLDPEGGDLLALPDDPELLADLTAGTYEITPRGIKIEAKDEIAARLGRSPDCGDAVGLSMLPDGAASLDAAAVNPFDMEY